MDVVTQQLQRFFGWHQRLVRIAQSVQELFLRETVLFPCEQTKYALPQLTAGIIRDLA